MVKEFLKAQQYWIFGECLNMLGFVIFPLSERLAGTNVAINRAVPQTSSAD